MNDLTLRFGSAPPDIQSAVGLSFISSPELTPDSTVAFLPIHQFAIENQSELHTFSAFQNVLENNVYISGNFDGVTLSPAGTGVGAWSILDTTNTTELTNSFYSLNALNSEIRSLGPKVQPNNTWGVGIQKGYVVRPYTVPSYEQADVWFRTGSLASKTTPGTSILLIYSVPEIEYQPLEGNNGITFPGQGVNFVRSLERTTPSGENSIKFTSPFSKVLSYTLNGTSYPATGTTVESIDYDTQVISVKSTLSPDDEITVTGLSLPGQYTYLGYRDRVTNQYFSFDANPEYGHFIGDSRYGSLRSSYDCLREQVTVYALPSAIGVYETIPGAGSNPSTCKLTFYSAYSFGETHFIRHLVGAQIEDIIPRIGDTSLNTYGFSIFGRNFYDESSTPRRDVFSQVVPSMLPLCRVMLKAPISASTVTNADMRIRGGGIPETFDLDKLKLEPNATRKLKSYYDIACWAGQPIQEGGAATVIIDPSVLAPIGKFTEEQVKEIVASRMPPGVEFTIKYQVVV
jgi:hypothetical protein